MNSSAASCVARAVGKKQITLCSTGFALWCMFTSCTSSGRWSSSGAAVSHCVTCVFVALSSSPTQST